RMNILLPSTVLFSLIIAFLALTYLMDSIDRLNSSSVSRFESRVNSADLLIGGCVLATLALAYIHIYRPSLQAGMSKKWKAWGTQNTLLLMWFLPLIVSAGLITTWWAWVANYLHSPNVLRDWVSSGCATSATDTFMLVSCCVS